MKCSKFVAVVPFLVMVLFLSTIAAAQDVPKMTKDELKAMLGNADLVTIDVRREGHWNGSDSKIKGAVREGSENVSSWASKYDKDKTYVLYCA